MSRAALAAALRGVGLPANALANLLDDEQPHPGAMSASLLEIVAYKGLPHSQLCILIISLSTLLSTKDYSALAGPHLLLLPAGALMHT